jgi:hypothetical protein
MARGPVLAFCLAVALHAASVGHGFVFDDHALVETNSRVQAFDVGAAFTTPYWGVERNDGLYRPITLVSFALDWKVGGGRPLWFHLVNVLLHGLVAALVVVFVRATLCDPFAGLAAGFLFAAHPVHVEAVQWIAGRAELLVALLVLAGLAATLLPSPIRFGTDRLRTILLVGAACLAVLSKEHGILALPLAILALLYLGPRAWRPIAQVLPLVVVLLVLVGGWLALREAAVGDPRHGTPVEDNPLVARSGTARVVGALAVGVRWIVQLLVPFSSSADYGAPVPLSGKVPVGLAAPLTALVLAGLLAAAIWLRRSRPGLAFWCAFLVLSYLPASNLLLPIGTVFAERLLYLPSVAVCALLGAGIAAIPRREIAGAVLVLVSCGYGGLSVARGFDWHSDRTLFEHEVAHPPHSSRAAVSLAHLVEDEDPERAERLYRLAEAMTPDSIGMHLAYGTFLLERGDAAGALRHLARADALYPDSPSTLLNLGAAYARLGRFAEAAQAWERLVAIDPGNARARENLERLGSRSGAP